VRTCGTRSGSPPWIRASSYPRSSRTRSTGRASFIGISAYFALNALAGSEESMLAGIPFAIGVAYLVYYFVQGRHEDAAALEKMKAKQP